MLDTFLNLLLLVFLVLIAYFVVIPFHVFLLLIQLLLCLFHLLLANAIPFILSFLRQSPFSKASKYSMSGHQLHFLVKVNWKCLAATFFARKLCFCCFFFKFNHQKPSKFYLLSISKYVRDCGDLTSVL